jgi:DtxR family transcriptional regulator, Mn-dependent transcriptional regulator
MKIEKEMWKSFDKTELTHSSIHHLMAIHKLIEQNGYARGTDISKYLDITRSSVSITINTLKDKGYVEEDQNKFYQLTEKGHKIVDMVLENRLILQHFFEATLELSAFESETEACKTEHLVSAFGIDRMRLFNSFYSSDSEAAAQFRAAWNKYIQKNEKTMKREEKR